jgi:UDP:flavonoid glycosyltransferase YjiC (YdhE family)
VPTAEALTAAGHDVMIGCVAAFAPAVDAAGLSPLSCESRPMGDVTPSGPPREQRNERLHWSLTVRWPAQARGWVGSLLEQASTWRPDLVVVEPVAAALGVPLVVHGWGFSVPTSTDAEATRALADAYAEFGTSSREPAVTVDLGAASIQSSDAGELPRFRYVPWALAGEVLPPTDGRPRVLVTLGTFDNPQAATRIRTCVQAAQDAGAQVVVALGNPDRRQGDAFPDDVIVADWLDLPAAIATSALVVHHGGAGTSWATLAAGRPALCLPQLGDQFRNAALLERAEVASVVQPEQIDGRRLTDLVGHLLTDDSAGERARRIQRENDELPPPAALAAALGRLV